MVQSQDTVLFAATQLLGQRDRQEDSFISFRDECFVVADGVGGMPHADIASQLVSETAMWGYKHVRQRKFYWADKEKLLYRIFRSANIAVWQKHREKGFEDGLASTLSVLIVGPRRIWVGSVGDSPIFLYREGLIDMLTPLDLDNRGFLTSAMGIKRFGLAPHVARESFLAGDMVLLATDGVTSFVDEEEMRAVFETAGTTQQSIMDAVVHLLQVAGEHGSTDNMTACLVKRLGHETM
ncbi:hypothetical protein A2Z00_00775 [Candidatus Gottesmanbacteria bacterium RBG_13_45_10]|uniref:PPM-type phosphatase domain-containing protein n=1 Tax=Candidatus Gottesmanbacteria bacterium RBG_13_45_10 TaxID=1798370 RepID=A0A1F5ZHC2_9BACT|nr:MAG: hypothetical protein A2Z00_00775 [Candidatus Gottesmanbacteria bacterium RBG_13_45_10]